MGYDTIFKGYFTFDTPLTPAQVAYIQKFEKTRRMKRCPLTVESLNDPLREAVGLPIGNEGEYYVGIDSSDLFSDNWDESITNHNCPPISQPGLWCNWTVSDDGSTLEWNEAEKFYNHLEWIHYFIDHFFNPWQKHMSGTIHWQGEEEEDAGDIVINNNVITVNYVNVSVAQSIATDRLDFTRSFARY